MLKKPYAKVLTILAVNSSFPSLESQSRKVISLFSMYYLLFTKDHIVNCDFCLGSRVTKAIVTIEEFFAVVFIINLF